MATAILNMGPGARGTCWDNLTIVIHGTDNVIPLIRFKDRHDAIEVYREIVVAHSDGHTGDLDLKINDVIHSFIFDQWQAVGGALEKWIEEYTALVEMNE